MPLESRFSSNGRWSGDVLWGGVDSIRAIGRKDLAGFQKDTPRKKNGDRSLITKTSRKQSQVDKPAASSASRRRIGV